MINIDKTEKRFESDIEAFFLSTEGGYTKGMASYSPDLGLFDSVLTDFVKETQPKAWARFCLQNKVNPERKFCLEFHNACVRDSVVNVIRHGFKHLGIFFRVCYFKPETSLNQTAADLYAANRVEVYRQWHYSSAEPHKSVDMVLAVNGIPVFAFELKNQMTGQSVENAELQWKTDRSPREVCFQFNRRVLGFFCVDLYEARVATRLDGDKTRFLPFNQGSNGPGIDGGKGNPENADGYVTHYIWDTVFRKNSMMDILQKFIHLQKMDGKETLIFPRYHQLDCVRKLIAATSAEGTGHNYLIQQPGVAGDVLEVVRGYREVHGHHAGHRRNAVCGTKDVSISCDIETLKEKQSMKNCFHKTNQYQYYKKDLVSKNGQISSLYIFRGFLSESDPREDMNNAIESIVGDVDYADFIERFLDNPWCRVVITNLDLLRSESSEDQTHHYSIFKKELIGVAHVFILFGGDNLLSPWDDMTSIVADKYGNLLHQEFIESSLDNPWDRVIIVGINDISNENWHGTI